MRCLAYAPALLLIVGCTTFSDLELEDVRDAGPAAPTTNCPASGCSSGDACSRDQDCQGGGCQAGRCVEPSMLPADGHKDGDETDVDCGGATTPKCADGKGCTTGDSCTSGVCQAGSCAAPSGTDAVKNGDETDVDCGGPSTGAARCDVGKACLVHEDCASDGCAYDKKCALAPSCTGHFGGDTCGRGEVGDADAQHESCCFSIPVDRPVAQGGPYVLDKYLITAGRMRAFIERFSGNVRAQFVNATPPAALGASWLDLLPSDMDRAYDVLGPAETQRAGCQVRDGTRTYWAPAAENTARGDIPHNYPQDVLDQKVQNCTTTALFYAFCMWDGGKLASSDEVLYAWKGTDNRVYPWGNAPTPVQDFDRANISYGHYFFPMDVKDNSAYMSPPGRMWTGNGPFGHADLMGPVLMNVRDSNFGLFWTGSVEGHAADLTIMPGEQWGAGSNRSYGAYGMAGGRCTR